MSMLSPASSPFTSNYFVPVYTCISKALPYCGFVHMNLLLTLYCLIYGCTGSTFWVCMSSIVIDLKSWRPILHISILSIIMLPSRGSTTRKMACMRVDFPLPVLPTTPTFFFPGIVQVIFFRTDGRCSA